MKNLLILQVFTALLVLAIIMSASSIHKDQIKEAGKQICLPFDLMVESLEKEFGETVQFSSQHINQTTWSFLVVNIHTGTWSWITVNDSMQGCIETVGQHGAMTNNSNVKYFDRHSL